MAAVCERRLVPSGLVFFMALSMLLTGCFVWQFKLPKQSAGIQAPPEVLRESAMCPKYPEPVPLAHPVPALREALLKVDQVLRYQVDTVRLPAVSAAIVYRDRVLWAGNFGMRNASQPPSVRPDAHTLYRIGGVSQLFPVLLLARLWEQRRVASLDDALARYAPDFSVQDPFGEGSAPPVTLRRLASHTSGLARRLRGTDLLWGGSTRDALALLRDDALVALPGTRCHYSSAAISLLAHVLAERVAGTAYETWLEQNVLRPMGMRDTTFHPHADTGERLAEGRYPDGTVPPLYNLGWYRPAGQMFSSVADLAKLSTLFLGTSHYPLLTRETLKMLLAPVQACQADYFAAKAGLPWEMSRQLGHTLLTKDGDIDGYAATLSLVPKLKLAFVLLIAGQRPQADLKAAVFARLLPALERVLREAPRAAWPAPAPRRYLGYYAYSNVTFYHVTTAPDGDGGQASALDAREADAGAATPLRDDVPSGSSKRRQGNRESQRRPNNGPGDKRAADEAGGGPAPQAERQPKRQRKTLFLRVFGPAVEPKLPEKFRTFQLSYLGMDVFRAEFVGPFPCRLERPPGRALPVVLEQQDQQIVNFRHAQAGPLCTGFDIPGLNIYNVRRLQGKPMY